MKFNLSPFRYPGGKTWLIPFFRKWMGSLGRIPELFIEPFAGGGIISITAVCENLVRQALMIEIDEQVSAVWRTILVNGDGEWLIQRIISFKMTRENAIAEIQTERKSAKEIAFQTILKNRISYGGIIGKAGFLKNGENGKGILSRWYPKTLAKRIRNLSTMRDRLHCIPADGFEALILGAQFKDIVFFIDPPYTAGGKRAGARLYNYSEIDHDRLFEICGSLKGDFLMTYDNCDEVKYLVKRHGFQMKSVAMRNTHHAEMTELLIGRDLSWLMVKENLDDQE